MSFKKREVLLWIVDIYSLILAGFLIATSSLSDRFGRKKMLLTGFLIFGIGSLLVLLVTEPEQLIAIRTFLGIGGAMIMPVTISMIRSIFIDSKDCAIALAGMIMLFFFRHDVTLVPVIVSTCMVGGAIILIAALVVWRKDISVTRRNQTA